MDYAAIPFLVISQKTDFYRKEFTGPQLGRSDLFLNGAIVRNVTSLGLPIALQHLLVGISFLVLLAIVNSLGLTPSAGVGVAERVCGLIMLIPSAFMQAMSAFVAQNIGAGEYRRARRALAYAIGVSSQRKTHK